MSSKPEDSNNEKRQQALERALSQIEKQFGKGAIMKLGSVAKVEVPTISTGALSLNLALGVGGIPRGRVIEIFGPESSGKTTLTLHIIANAQKAGGIAAFIDAEHALDSDYARRLGVDINNLMVNQPDTGEQALEIAELLVRSNAVDVVAIDSVAALVPRAEIEGEMGDSHMGLQARLMSQALRKLTGCIAKSQQFARKALRYNVVQGHGKPHFVRGDQILVTVAAACLTHEPCELEPVASPTVSAASHSEQASTFLRICFKRRLHEAPASGLSAEQ